MDNPDYPAGTITSAVRTVGFRPERGRTRWGVHLALIATCFLLGLPVLYAILVATTDTLQASAYPPELLGNDLFNNIRSLFEVRGFDRLIANTVIVSLVVVIAKTAISILAGLAFVYFHFPGKWFLFFFVLLTLLMPTEIIIQPLFNLVSDLHWRNTNPRLALTMPFLGSAVGAFLFRQHFSNIPRELAEASQIDGAGPLRFLMAVLVPMSWNVIGAHAMIQFIGMWNQYVWPVLLLQGDSQDQVIQVGVKQALQTSGQVDYGLLMTAGLIASIPPLILFIALQKQFMNGFAITRDK